jgi:hypothetical protein
MSSKAENYLRGIGAIPDVKVAKQDDGRCIITLMGDPDKLWPFIMALQESDRESFRCVGRDIALGLTEEGAS